MTNHPYGRTSSRRLEASTPEVRRVMLRASHYADISILCTYRGREQQRKAFLAGFSEVDYPNSDHNMLPSPAVDAGIWRPDLHNVDFEDHAAFGTLNGIIQVCALEEGCVAIWGHDWDHDWNFKEHKFKDRPHWLILSKEEYERRIGR
jgi:peptidoglycan L-alanyl-D-glutamate endopeptidase CwlK